MLVGNDFRAYVINDSTGLFVHGDDAGGGAEAHQDQPLACLPQAVNQGPMDTFEKRIDREVGRVEMVGCAPFPEQLAFSVDLLYDITVNDGVTGAGDAARNVFG